MFWKYFFLFCLALVVIALVIAVLKVVLLLAIVAGIGYGSYRGVRWLMTAKQRRLARMDARINQLENEMGMK